MNGEHESVRLDGRTFLRRRVRDAEGLHYSMRVKLGKSTQPTATRNSQLDKLNELVTTDGIFTNLYSWAPGYLENHLSNSPDSGQLPSIIEPD